MPMAPGYVRGIRVFSRRCTNLGSVCLSHLLVEAREVYNTGRRELQSKCTSTPQLLALAQWKLPEPMIRRTFADMEQPI